MQFGAGGLGDKLKTDGMETRMKKPKQWPQTVEQLITL